MGNEIPVSGLHLPGKLGHAAVMVVPLALKGDEAYHLGVLGLQIMLLEKLVYAPAEVLLLIERSDAIVAGILHQIRGVYREKQNVAFPEIVNNVLVPVLVLKELARVVDEVDDDPVRVLAPEPDVEFVLAYLAGGRLVRN